MTCYCGGCASCMGAQGYDVRRLPNGRSVVIETEEDLEAFEQAADNWLDQQIEARRGRED